LSQERWNAKGFVQTVTLLEAGLRQDLAYAFSSQSMLEETLERGIKNKMIAQNKDEDGAPVYSPIDGSQHQTLADIIEGLVFVTYIYPRGEGLNKS
jgi:hypothetical protein